MSNLPPLCNVPCSVLHTPDAALGPVIVIPTAVAAAAFIARWPAAGSGADGGLEVPEALGHLLFLLLLGAPVDKHGIEPRAQVQLSEVAVR